MWESTIAFNFVKVYVCGTRFVFYNFDFCVDVEDIQHVCVELFVKFNTCVAFNVVKLDVCMREFFVILKMCRMRIFEARHGFREILNMCGNRFCDIKLCVL